VSLADVDQAATALVEERQNAAFENHWADADRATHRLLAGLAWATTDEGTRVQIDLAGIEAALRETRLALPPGEAFGIVERLADAASRSLPKLSILDLLNHLVALGRMRAGIGRRDLPIPCAAVVCAVSRLWCSMRCGERRRD
jgi:hypothetical protein